MTIIVIIIAFIFLMIWLLIDQKFLSFCEYEFTIIPEV